MPFILLFLLSLAQAPVFYLDADLKRARHILSDDHNVWLSKADEPYTLKVFEPYAKINLTSFAFKSRREGKYIINSWKSKDKQRLEIYQVETSLHVDSTFVTSNYTDLAGKRTVEHTHIVTDFNYRIYVIKNANKPQLVFTIATNGDHLYYAIGNHSVDPMYESIPVGLKIPDEKEIISLVFNF